MKRILVIFSLVFVVVFSSFAQFPETVKPVKNVIVMVSDGTTLGAISAARWYKKYNKMGDNLHIDPYLCGTVLTCGSDEPIADSAPTMSCYMTGVPAQSGNVAIYPVANPEHDLVRLDPTLANQPLVTLLEAARIQQGKSTGVVVTCEFTHATPANCASHHPERGAYKFIAPQMAYNNLDVLFGGGTSLVSDDMKAHFKNNGTTLIEDDLTAFRNFRGDGKLWALFGRMAMPYDLDRDPQKMPSIEEMTRKAIEQLSKNKNGFFLMVEGSQVDWAAHANDAVGTITEFIAFDNALGAALEFARKDGETVVFVLADHGTGGVSVGRNGWKGSSLKDMFGPISQYKKAAPGMTNILNETPPDQVKAVFARYTNIELADSELQSILQARDYKMGEAPRDRTNPSLSSVVIQIMNLRTPLGFTTGSHTGEEVFLAVYHPAGHRPTGMITNMQVNQYLFRAMGLTTPLLDLSKRLFAKHTEVLAGLKYEIAIKDDFPILTVTRGKNTMTVSAYSSVAYVNGKPFDLGSVTVYIDRNKTFYLPADILKKTGL